MKQTRQASETPTIQDRVLNKLVYRIEQFPNIECSHRGAWANTGRVFLHKKNELDALMIMYYEFQDTYCILTFYVKGGSEKDPFAKVHANYLDSLDKAFGEAISHINRGLELARNPMLRAAVERG